MLEIIADIVILITLAAFCILALMWFWRVIRKASAFAQNIMVKGKYRAHIIAWLLLCLLFFPATYYLNEFKYVSNWVVVDMVRLVQCSSAVAFFALVFLFAGTLCSSGKLDEVKIETPKVEVGKVKSSFPSCGCLMLVLLVSLVIFLHKPRLGPYIVRAHYAADGIPVIGNLQTKIELYHLEHDYFPGIPIKEETGMPIVNSSGYATSHLPDSAVAAGANCSQWMQMESTGSDNNMTQQEVLFCDGRILGNPMSHVWRQLDIHHWDLTGSYLHPHHVQYAAIMSSSNAYYYVVACLGDGKGLHAGTGRAVAEFNDQANEHKFVAEFENYKPIEPVPLSIHVGPMDHEGGKTTDRETMLKAGKVFLPTAEMLLTDYDSTIKAMRDFGWQVELNPPEMRPL